MNKEDWFRWQKADGHKIYWECRRKFAFEDYLSATTWASHVDRKIGPLSTYICEHCGMFHIGRTPRIERLRNYCKELQRRLNDQGFVTKAPPEIVEEARNNLRDNQRWLSYQDQAF